MTVWTDDMKRAAMADAALVCKQAKRIDELTAALCAVMAKWQPTRDDYRTDRKGQRQYEQARDVWVQAHRAILK